MSTSKLGSANPTKWSNTLKRFVGKNRGVVWVFDNFVGLAVKRLKEDSGAAFFCEFCEIFMNNYFFEHIRTAASNLSSSVFGKFLTVIEIQFPPVYQCLFMSKWFYKFLQPQARIYNPVKNLWWSVSANKINCSIIDIWHAFLIRLYDLLSYIFHFPRLCIWLNVWALFFFWKCAAAT